MVKPGNRYCKAAAVDKPTDEWQVVIGLWLAVLNEGEVDN